MKRRPAQRGTRAHRIRWSRQMHENGELALPCHGDMALKQDQKRVRELEKKLKDTKMERDILKKTWPSSAEHRNEIDIHCEESLVMPVKKMCHLLKVSQSGYYRRLNEKTLESQTIAPDKRITLSCITGNKIAI